DSVGFVNDEVLAEFEKIERIRPYLAARAREIAEHNAKFGADKSHPINGRHMTNLGVFRAYAHAYLEEHPLISNAHTLMVRQLPVTGQGVPLEIYCFATTIVWTEYEGIASDLFDHLIAAAPSFGLNLFQAPTAASVRSGTLPLE
ncbi:MAG: mechanosensitive ion channel family protein, partial [Schleiferiaceae bacterium]